jgi:concentrative nucleoside transporter, CNT family
MKFMIFSFSILHQIMQYLTDHNRFFNIVGITVILGIAYLFSHKRSHIQKKLIAQALILQCIIACMILKTATGLYLIEMMALGVKNLYLCGDTGIAFLFGSLAQADGPWGFIFAIKVLPLIIFFGAFMSILFHYGIVQRLVALIGRVLQPLLGTSGAETLCAIANSFLGQTEAPLLIRNYLKQMSHSELLVVMVSGMGTISGAILAVYSAMGVPALHLLTSSVMAIPSTILIAKILYPETKDIRERAVVDVQHDGNLLQAIASGTSDGLSLALNVAAMLISYIALIGLINIFMSYLSSTINNLFALAHLSWVAPSLTLEKIFGFLFVPFGWLLGLGGQEAFQAGELIGTKLAINEMVAYSKMVTMQLSPRALTLLTYALCGFSNFSCIGIQIGGIGALAPEKRASLSELGLYAVLGGMLSNLLSAMIVGLVI